MTAPTTIAERDTLAATDPAERAKQEADAQHAIAQIRLAMRHPALVKAKRWHEID